MIASCSDAKRFSLVGRTVMVTGTGSGIGAHLARVVLTAPRVETLEEVAQDICFQLFAWKISRRKNTPESLSGSCAYAARRNFSRVGWRIFALG
jgi:NADP-dependent 3-hydroxy acid dehydrogenase YdfG